MALAVTHGFVSGIADDPAAAAAGDVLPSHWNAAHTIDTTNTTLKATTNLAMQVGQTADILDATLSDGTTVLLRVLSVAPPDPSTGVLTIYDKDVALDGSGALVTVHQDDQAPYAMAFFNDTVSTSQAVVNYYIDNHGNFFIGTNSSVGLRFGMYAASPFQEWLELNPVSPPSGANGRVNVAVPFGYDTNFQVASVGGTVTQLTSKSTGVTLSKPCGQITMNNAALGAGVKVSFTVTNTMVGTADVPLVAIQGGGTVDAYRANVAAVGAGSFDITVENVTGGPLSEAVVINFVLFHGTTT